jgi:hypothetical protein
MTTSYVVKVALHSGGSRIYRLVHRTFYRVPIQKVKQMLKSKGKNRKAEKVKAETMRLVPMLPTVQSGVHISALMVIG